MQITKTGPNVTVLTLSSGSRVLFSYNAPVAVYVARSHGQYAGGYWKTSQFYSRTTSRHVAEFLMNAPADNVRIVEQSVIDDYVKEAR